MPITPVLQGHLEFGPEYLPLAIALETDQNRGPTELLGEAVLFHTKQQDPAVKARFEDLIHQLIDELKASGKDSFDQYVVVASALPEYVNEALSLAEKRLAGLLEIAEYNPQMELRRLFRIISDLATVSHSSECINMLVRSHLAYETKLSEGIDTPRAWVRNLCIELATTGDFSEQYVRDVYRAYCQLCPGAEYNDEQIFLDAVMTVRRSRNVTDFEAWLGGGTFQQQLGI